MDERTYDPAFAVPVKPNHEGECQFVRFHLYLERCAVPGCPVGRISRDWIASMRRAPSADTNGSERL